MITIIYVDFSNGLNYLKDPAVNQAISEFLEQHPKLNDTLFYFFHPQTPIVICGVNQNVYAEVNLEYLKKHNIRLARRGAGGGAVYVDPGNLTYCFIDTDNGTNYQNFQLYAQPALKVLHKLGVDAIFGGRNDLTVNGKKFSGMSSLKIGSRFSCGGTLMIDVDLDAASKVLHPTKAKLASKGVKSVHSRVTNIRQYFKPEYKDITFDEIQDMMLKEVFKTDSLADIPTYKLTDQDFKDLNAIDQEKYGSKEWIYGPSEDDQTYHDQHFEGIGTVGIGFSVQNGFLVHPKIYGDFSLMSGNLGEIEDNLKGVPMNYDSLKEALHNSHLEKNIGKVSADAIAKMILDPNKSEVINS